MEHIQELQKQASDACLLRVSTHTVGIINSIRTVGFDPITHRRGDGEEMGTGCAGCWGKHHFILTAGHVLHSDAKPPDLRIFWRPSGGIERIADADLRPQDIVDGIAIRDPKAVIHRCGWEDLAMITINPAEAGQIHRVRGHREQLD